MKSLQKRETTRETIGDFCNRYLHRLALHAAAGKSTAKRIAFVPSLSTDGSFPLAEQMMAGKFLLAGQLCECGNIPLWSVAPPSPEWHSKLHGFSWLAHFSAAEGPRARRFAKEAVISWLMKYSKSAAKEAWRIGTVGERVTSWLRYARLLGHPRSRGGVDLPIEILQSLSMQAEYLCRRVHYAPEGYARISAAVGSVFAGLCLEPTGNMFENGLEALNSVLAKEILSDGGHISRSPTELLNIFALLIALKQAIEEGKRKPSATLTDALARMAPMLRMLRLGDGQLTCFHGGWTGEPGRLDQKLAESDERVQPPDEAPDMGYHRLRAGRTIILVDTAPPPKVRPFRQQHSSGLAFEMSVGRRRLIVNCGDGRHLGKRWREATRTAAAHSTLDIETSPSRNLLHRRFSASLLGRLIGKELITITDRHRDNLGVWLRTSYNIHQKEFGLIHGRRMFINVSGDDFRGEDILFWQTDSDKKILENALAKNKQSIQYSVRFHIHPDVRTEMSADGSYVRLSLPNDDAWIFRQRGSKIHLEESVYLCHRGLQIRRSQQIVLRSSVTSTDEKPVQWAIQRMRVEKGTPRDFAYDPEQEPTTPILPNHPEQQND